MLRVFLLALLALLWGFPANAEADDERAQALFNQLRCVVCQNQSIADSEAGVAKDLRQLVREQIAAGRSDAEIIDFLVARYGEFVLLKPRFTARTLILWLSPLLVAMIGIFLIARMRSVAKKDVPSLDAEEEAKLAALVEIGANPNAKGKR